VGDEPNGFPNQGFMHTSQGELRGKKGKNTDRGAQTSAKGGARPEGPREMWCAHMLFLFFDYKIDPEREWRALNE